jgi:hypothetical protein
LDKKIFLVVVAQLGETGFFRRVAPVLPFIKAQFCPIFRAVCYHGDGFTASIRMSPGTGWHREIRTAPQKSCTALQVIWFV